MSIQEDVDDYQGRKEDENELDFDDDEDLPPIPPPPPVEQAHSPPSDGRTHEVKRKGLKEKGTGSLKALEKHSRVNKQAARSASRTLDPLYCSYQDYLQALRQAGEMQRRGDERRRP